MQRVLAKITECETFNLLVDTLHLEFTELHQFDFLEQEGYYIGEREKILLCAGNSCISSPRHAYPCYLLAEQCIARVGKAWKNLLTKIKYPGQSAGNFSFSTKATASTKNTYYSFSSLPKISEHVPKHNSNLNDQEFGFFLAGLIEGVGWFGLNELHIIFSERDIPFLQLILLKSV